MECFSVTFNIPVSKIDDTELLNQERFLKVIQSEKLGDPDVKYLSKLVNLYHPGLDIVFFKKRRNTPHNWDLEHPLIELHLGNFKGLKKHLYNFVKGLFISSLHGCVIHILHSTHLILMMSLFGL